MTESDQPKNRKEKIIEMMEMHPEGISAVDIITEVKITMSSLYSAMHELRGVGCKIINTSGKYFLRKKSATAVTVPQHQTTLQTGKFAKGIRGLSETDLTDYLDMMKKSYFYRKSADALIEANEMVSQLRHTLLT